LEMILGGKNPSYLYEEYFFPLLKS
jgi:hypothetical protein